MNNLELRRYDMLKRVRDFGTTHAALFPPNGLGTVTFAELASVVAQLAEHAGTETSVGGTARQRQTQKSFARDLLRADLEAVSRTARAIALESPGLDAKFRMPRSAGDQALLNTARAFMRDAAPFTAEFVRYEMPSDFLSKLNEHVIAFEQAGSERNAASQAGTVTSGAIDGTIERGMNAVKKLDALIQNKFRDDDAMLAAWTRAKRVERAARTEKTPTENPPQPAS